MGNDTIDAPLGANGLFMHLYNVFCDELSGRDIALPEAIYVTKPSTVRIDTVRVVVVRNRKHGAS